MAEKAFSCPLSERLLSPSSALPTQLPVPVLGKALEDESLLSLQKPDGIYGPAPASPANHVGNDSLRQSNKTLTNAKELVEAMRFPYVYYMELGKYEKI